jgi:uncharacterized protein
MHLVELAVSDTRLAAAVAQAPLTDGLAAAMMSPLKNGSRIFALALLDRLGSLFGRQPIYIPGHGMLGTCPSAPRRTAHSGRSSRPRRMGRYGTTGWLRGLCSASPGVDQCDALPPCVSPCLLVVPEADAIAPVPAALEVARRAQGAELFRSGGGHYDVYEGGASFADVLRMEVDFLHRHAKTAAEMAS